MGPIPQTGHRSGQHGFTLLELMISVTIGIIVVLSATGLVVTSSESRRIVKHSAELQEEAFYITHLLRQQLAQAGFRNLNSAGAGSRTIPISNRSDHYPASGSRWKNGQLIRVAGNALFYRFDGASLPDGSADRSIFDCLGNAIPAGAIIESSIALQDNNLICTVGTNTAMLIDGRQNTRVEQMLITLGVDSNNDGEIDYAVDSSLASADDFENSRSITVRLLLATADNVIKHHQTYYFNGTATATDNRLRTEATISVALRH
jgi:prepilin-type N-terminal cleavage/methylation domain-containing protein